MLSIENIFYSVDSLPSNEQKSAYLKDCIKHLKMHLAREGSKIKISKTASKEILTHLSIRLEEIERRVAIEAENRITMESNC